MDIVTEQAAPILPGDGRILYFARDREAFPFLSHFYAAPIQLDGVEWPSVEYYYQAQKCDRHAYREAIRTAKTPGMAKRLAAPPDAPQRVSHAS
ncbi:MAG: hypothetical protein ACLP8A_00955 [Methylovirgula sp.]